MTKVLCFYVLAVVVFGCTKWCVGLRNISLCFIKNSQKNKSMSKFMLVRQSDLPKHHQPPFILHKHAFKDPSPNAAISEMNIGQTVFNGSSFHCYFFSCQDPEFSPSELRIHAHFSFLSSPLVLSRLTVSPNVLCDK